tara:strand:+ start:1995 stop:2528 length:534 start_codon:yes stop_codon:yes gene_type:complete
MAIGAIVKGVGAIARGLQQRRANKESAAATSRYLSALEDIGEKDFSLSDAAINQLADDANRAKEKELKQLREGEKRARAAGHRVTPTTQTDTSYKGRQVALGHSRKVAADRRKAAKELADVKYKGKREDIANRLAAKQQFSKEMEGAVVYGSEKREGKTEAAAQRDHEMSIIDKRYG